MSRLTKPYQGGNGSTLGMFSARDSRHAFGGQRFYAETESSDKKWYVFFGIVLTVIAGVLL